MRPWWKGSEINDAVLIALVDRCPALTNVTVSYSRKLTDAAIVALAKRCHALINVNVCDCEKLTDAGMQPSLHSLMVALVSPTSM